jgi:hypothetical protein
VVIPGFLLRMIHHGGTEYTEFGELLNQKLFLRATYVLEKKSPSETRPVHSKIVRRLLPSCRHSMPERVRP